MRFFAVISLILITAFPLHPGFQDNYNIIFLGDNILLEGKWTELLKRDDIYYFYHCGALTGNMRKYTQSVIMMKPKIVFIMGGIMDFIEKGNPQQVYQNLAGIVSELQVNGIIPVVHSVLHVNDKYWGAYQLNPKIKEINILLSRYCKNSGIDYIDLNSLFAPENQLLEKYAFDGMRLTQDAYRLWAEEIRRILQKYAV